MREGPLSNVHGDIRHLEKLRQQRAQQQQVHGDIRHLEIRGIGS